MEEGATSSERMANEPAEGINGATIDSQEVETKPVSERAPSPSPAVVVKGKWTGRLTKAKDEAKEKIEKITRFREHGNKDKELCGSEKSKGSRQPALSPDGTHWVTGAP